jgi:hypothetical protein
MPSIKPLITSSGSHDIGGRCSLRMGKELKGKLLSHIPEIDPDIEVAKLNVQEDHVHMVVVIPQRYADARVVKYIKSKSAKAPI